MAFLKSSPGRDGKPLTVCVTFGAGPDGLLARLAEVAQALRAPTDCQDARRLVNKVETELPSSVLVCAIVLDDTTPEQVQQELLGLVPPIGMRSGEATGKPRTQAGPTLHVKLGGPPIVGVLDTRPHTICAMVNGVCSICGDTE